MTRKHHTSTLKRMEEIRNVAAGLYEAGNQARCYAAIWRSRIRPVYGVCYRTFMGYVHAGRDKTPESKTPAEPRSPMDPVDARRETALKGRTRSLVDAGRGKNPESETRRPPAP